MTGVVLDTHVAYWWALDPDRLSGRARSAIQGAEELVVASVTWWELAWLVSRGRLRVRTPLRAWLAELASGVRTSPLTPAIAATAAELPGTFTKDPFDCLIYATAVETGLPLVSADRAMRTSGEDGRIVW